MKLSSIALLSLTGLASAAPHGKKAPETFAQNVIFTPPDNYTDPRVLYARSAQLEDGTLLATWENYSPEPPPVWFPIYQSNDNGYTWEEISRVQDTQQEWGLRYQPFLYVLPEDFGDYKKGDVLLSGSSIPTDLSQTQIELYGSRDAGKTWTFISHIAAGGEARPNNGLTPVWEPFLMMYKDTLICYYSDQRENATYGQKMVHQTTTDLKTWGPVIDDVTYPEYTDRPGMPIVDRLPNGKYIMTYEYGGSDILPDYQFPVYYKIVEDPEEFGEAEGISLQATDGTIPTGSPYNVWTPYGGENGTIVVSAHSSGDIYLNTGLGEGPWTKVPTPEESHYTRHLRILQGNEGRLLLIMGAGQLPPSETNEVQVTVMDLETVMGGY